MKSTLLTKFLDIYSINYMNIVVEQRNIMLDAWNFLLVKLTAHFPHP